VSSGLLAISLVLLSAVSDRGRKPLMVASMFSAAILTILSAFAQDTAAAAIRAALGIALGGMPAVAMAYLGEEIEGPSLGLSMACTLPAARSAACRDGWWRPCSAISCRGAGPGRAGVAGVLAAAESGAACPRRRISCPAPKAGMPCRMPSSSIFPTGACRGCSALAFVLMGCFVSLYNYIGYRLLAAPFSLRQSTVGLLAFLYLIGIFSSVWAGRLTAWGAGALWIMLSVMLSGIY
jgi:YNFM family putative membrane transporter